MDFNQRGSTTKVASTNNVDIVSMLRDSIMSLNQKFDTFNTTVTTKIDAIESNYVDLNSKID